MFTEDLTPLFDVAGGFAVNATLGAATVPVIFDNAYLSALLGVVESSGPQCIGRTSDLVAAAHGITITIGGTAYTITGVEPDGTGVTTLQLRG